MGLFFNDVVVVYRPGTKTNRADETTLDYAGLRAEISAGTANGVDRAGVHVRPIGQTEVNDDDRAAQISTWAISTRPGTGDWDIRATDWVLIPTGELLQLTGEPARPSDPTRGTLHHVEIRAERAVG